MLKVSNINSRTKYSKLTICSKLKMKICKWRKCHPSVFIVNFEHPSHLFLVFSIGDFEQVINCYGIKFTSLYSNSVTRSSCLWIYALILIDLLLNLQKLHCCECFETHYVFFSYLHFNLILFTSTKFCTLLTQFDVIQGEFLGYVVKSYRIISELKFQTCCFEITRELWP